MRIALLILLIFGLALLSIIGAAVGMVAGFIFGPILALSYVKGKYNSTDEVSLYQDQI